jgi:hypothetical protein
MLLFQQDSVVLDGIVRKYFLDASEGERDNLETSVFGEEEGVIYS